MKFEYFDGHGRGLSIKILLEFLKVEYEDERLSMKEFGGRKAAGKYKYG